MRSTLVIGLILFVVSCAKPGNDPTPTPPLPPVDSSQLSGSAINFGKLLFFRDTFRLYDANTGKLLINNYRASILSGVDDDISVTIDSGLVYQCSKTTITAVTTNNTPVFAKYFEDAGTGGDRGIAPGNPIIEGQYLYHVFYNYAGSSLYCLDRRTGNTVWKTSENLGWDQNTGFIDKIDQTSQNIIVTGIYGPACFSKQTGQLVWQNDSSAGYEEFIGYPKVCSEDIVLFLSKQNSSIYAFNAHNGAFLWKQPIPTPLGTYINSGFYFKDNKIFITSALAIATPIPGSVIFALDPTTGQILYNFTYQMGQAVCYYDKYFYLFEGTSVFASTLTLSKHLLTDGSLVWSKSVNGPFSDALVATPGFLYYSVGGTGPQKMDIIDQVTGNLLKEYPVLTNRIFTPIVMDSLNNVYYQLLNGYQ